MTERDAAAPDSASQPGRTVLAALLAWLVPGAGHFYLGRRGRAAIFFGVVVVGLAMGVLLSGNLYRIAPNQPLSTLGTLAAMGAGAPYFLLRFVFGYQGEIVAAGYEYGTAFLLTAGLMNWLLVLDCWDIGSGRKD